MKVRPNSHRAAQSRNAVGSRTACTADEICSSQLKPSLFAHDKTSSPTAPYPGRFGRQATRRMVSNHRSVVKPSPLVAGRSSDSRTLERLSPFDSYWPLLPNSLWTNPLRISASSRRSFPHTAAGQSRILTGVPSYRDHNCLWSTSNERQYIGAHAIRQSAGSRDFFAFARPSAISSSNKKNSGDPQTRSWISQFTPEPVSPVRVRCHETSRDFFFIQDHGQFTQPEKRAMNSLFLFSAT